MLRKTTILIKKNLKLELKTKITKSLLSTTQIGVCPSLIP